MTIDTGFFKLGPRHSILGNPEAMRTNNVLKSKLSFIEIISWLLIYE